MYERPAENAHREGQVTDSLDKNYYGPEDGKERGAYCLQE